jgi:hypothetical protein
MADDPKDPTPHFMAAMRHTITAVASVAAAAPNGSPAAMGHIARANACLDAFELALNPPPKPEEPPPLDPVEVNQATADKLRVAQRETDDPRAALAAHSEQVKEAADAKVAAAKEAADKLVADAQAEADKMLAMDKAASEQAAASLAANSAVGGEPVRPNPTAEQGAMRPPPYTLPLNRPHPPA